MATFRMTERMFASRAGAAVAEWDEQALRHWVVTSLASDQVIVVSDRQPFSHDRINGQLRVTQPASGLVTAVEPIVRACAGTWVAHGSGNADQEVVDERDVWHAPAASGSYRLRRVWITDAETRGYRHGFANSGLWPLCHMVHVRPTFVERDWTHYCEVNRRFADAVVEEARQPDPVVLVHDYHLALVPAMLRKRLPRAMIVSFWHIPWTSPEQMGICPWLADVMQGLLGSDIVGFQTEQHRLNFIAAAQRCGMNGTSAPSMVRIGRPHSSLVRDYPISIAWPTRASSLPVDRQQIAAKVTPRAWELPVGAKLMVGIDRFDYTKGLIERLHAVEHLLTHHPEWCGRLKLVQVAAPTRTVLTDYVVFREQVFAEVRRINDRFRAEGWEPIVLLDVHHGKADVQALYRAADLCLVTSLHDGMNLVSKEFVAARDDEQGVLVLSEFAGAAHELAAALIVNPYHIERVADALHRGLLMSPAEQQQRMQALRATVKKNNVYRWAAHMLQDAAHLRDSRLAHHLPKLLASASAGASASASASVAASA
jgi:trehalose-6-phosphate synthase